MNRRKLLLIIIIVLIVTSMTFALYLYTASDGSISFFDWMYEITVQFGYLGVFLVSLIGTLAIVIPIPYTLVILFLGIEGWNPLLLTVAGGLGSAIGEFAGYVLGYYGRRIISEERRRRMDYLLKIFGKYTPVAIFLFALTPLPDDLLFIPLGMLRYSPVKAFIPSLSGKLLMVFILASFGKIYGDILALIFGDERSWVGAVVTAALLIIVIYVLYQVDWERVFDKYIAKRGDKRVESDS